MEKPNLCKGAQKGGRWSNVFDEARGGARGRGGVRRCIYYY